MSDTITYVLTKEELFSALWHTRRSNGRLLLQTVALAALGLPPLIGLFFGFRDAAAVLMGVALPLLAVLQWVLPAVSFWREAASLAEKKTVLTIVFNNDALTVENYTVALQNATLRCVKELVLWQVDTQWIAIPRRVLSEEMWQRLLEKTEEG